MDNNNKIYTTKEKLNQLKKLQHRKKIYIRLIGIGNNKPILIIIG